MLKGKKLVKGSKIGVVAPANFIEKDELSATVKKLEELGFHVVPGRSCTSRWHSFAGTDEVRASDINAMFADDEIDGIIAMRGGYGSIRLLDKLDYDMIAKNPKVFMGYSDLTSLHSVLNSRCELITFHGPMAVSNILKSFDEVTAGSFYAAVGGGHKGYSVENPAGEELGVLNPGTANGRITGGNLAVMVSTLGTEYEIDTKDKILFIEDIGEATYRVDRMLIQLMQAGKLQDAAGILIGDFTDCNKESEYDLSIDEVFEGIFSKVDIPVMFNLRSGHCKPMVTLPFGAKALMDTKKKMIEIKEGTVE